MEVRHMSGEHKSGAVARGEGKDTVLDGPSSPLRAQRGNDPGDTVIALTTVPDVLLAKRIAHILVEESLAACVNLGAPGLSMFMWQGTLEGTDELTLTIKTTVACLPALHARLCALHPYEVPEFLVLSVQGGSLAYLEWVAGQTAPRTD
jgi:periplasmic divalent cation tolerance protein